MKRLFFTLLLTLSATQLNAKFEAYGGDKITPGTLPKVVHLYPGDSHTFDVNSTFSRRPVSVHRQNRDYLFIRCKRGKKQKKEFSYSCKISVKDHAAVEGTFAVFKKTKKKPYPILFHLSIEEKEENDDNDNKK